MNGASPLTWRSAAVFALLILSLRPLCAADFDFSPEQRDRPHVVRDAMAALPKNYAFVRQGALTVAIVPLAPPIATYAVDAKTVVGADADIANLIADSLGLKLDLEPIAWPDWPLGLVSGRYDAVISNVGVTEERKEKFDFSTYRLGLHGFYVPNGSSLEAIREPRDAAGLRIITNSGTNQEKILLEWNKRNLAAGRKAIELQYYDDPTEILLTLLAGRADAIFNPNGALAYEAAKTGKIRSVGAVNAGWPLKSDVAVATRKGGRLAEAITLALNDVMASGQYSAVLARWRLSEEALPKSETNPPGLPKL